MHAICCRSFENQSAIDFEEMVVAANLNRPVAGVFHASSNDATVNVRFDLSLFDEVLAWVHCSNLDPQITQIRPDKKNLKN